MGRGSEELPLPGSWLDQSQLNMAAAHRLIRLYLTAHISPPPLLARVLSRTNTPHDDNPRPSSRLREPRSQGVITRLELTPTADTFRGVGGGVVENHTAGGERPTGLEAPRASEPGVTAPECAVPTSGAENGRPFRQGCTGCEAPQGRPATKPPVPQGPAARSGASLLVCPGCRAQARIRGRSRWWSAGPQGPPQPSVTRIRRQGYSIDDLHTPKRPLPTERQGAAFRHSWPNPRARAETAPTVREAKIPVPPWSLIARKHQATPLARFPANQ